MTLQNLLSYTRRACEDYDMISSGDVIAVGVSGGKDSLALLTALKAMEGFYPKKYRTCAVTVDMGFENADYSEISRYCDELGVEFILVKTELKKLIFDVRKEHNPCALCSKMRKGALVNACAARGITKIALGHHMDDVIETFFLNLMRGGRIDTFSPVTHLSRSGVTVIRPLVYVPEKKIVAFASKNPLPISKAVCPADKKTEREEIKKLINDLCVNNRDLKSKVFGAIKRAGLGGFRDEKEPGNGEKSSERST